MSHTILKWDFITRAHLAGQQNPVLLTWHVLPHKALRLYYIGPFIRSRWHLFPSSHICSFILTTKALLSLSLTTLNVRFSDKDLLIIQVLSTGTHASSLSVLLSYFPCLWNQEQCFMILILFSENTDQVLVS